jgi:hypothetical protein
VRLIAFALQAALISGISRFHLEHSTDDFGVRSHGIIETIGPHRTKFYPLPQSTAREYRLLRPKDFRLNPFKPEQYERQEVIGPYQVEDGKIWFGNNYYDGEGERGVGAFGYFDTSIRRYTLFSPPEVAPYEVSAILVEPDAVWIALDHFGEDICTSPGGLIRWDRTTHEIRRYSIEFVINRIDSDRESLRLSTGGGYALLRDGKLQRYLNNGKPINKFPPPPSHY